MNILNKAISKTNALKNKKLIEAIPKNFGLNLVSNKTFFVKTNLNFNYNVQKFSNCSTNSFSKLSKFNMSTSKILYKFV